MFESFEIRGRKIGPGKPTYVIAEIISAAAVQGSRIFDGAKLKRPESIEAVRVIEADIALSVLFDYIFEPDFIQLFPAGVVNLHPSYLPYNRGQFPNVWSIVEGTPAGATLHYIDAGIDTGDIIAQAHVSVEPVDTGKSLYHKLERASLELFKAQWPMIRSGHPCRKPQSSDSGTYHRSGDVDEVDHIDLEKLYKAGDLINIMRARTFAPHNFGGYVVHPDTGSWS